MSNPELFFSRLFEKTITFNIVVDMNNFMTLKCIHSLCLVELYSFSANEFSVCRCSILLQTRTEDRVRFVYRSPFEVNEAAFYTIKQRDKMPLGRFSIQSLFNDV